MVMMDYKHAWCIGFFIKQYKICIKIQLKPYLLGRKPSKCNIFKFPQMIYLFNIFTDLGHKKVALFTIFINTYFSHTNRFQYIKG